MVVSLVAISISFKGFEKKCSYEKNKLHKFLFPLFLFLSSYSLPSSPLISLLFATPRILSNLALGAQIPVYSRCSSLRSHSKFQTYFVVTGMVAIDSKKTSVNHNSFPYIKRHRHRCHCRLLLFLLPFVPFDDGVKTVPRKLGQEFVIQPKQVRRRSFEWRFVV